MTDLTTVYHQTLSTVNGLAGVIIVAAVVLVMVNVALLLMNTCFTNHDNTSKPNRKYTLYSSL